MLDRCRELLEQIYARGLEPLACRAVLVVLDDPICEEGPSACYISLFERNPDTSIDDWEHHPSHQEDLVCRFPVDKEGEWAVCERDYLYAYRTFREAMLQLREQQHPVGSAALYVGQTNGPSALILKKTRAFPSRFNFEERIQAVRVAFAEERWKEGMALLGRMPPCLGKAQAKQFQALLERWRAQQRTRTDRSGLTASLDELQVGPFFQGAQQLRKDLLTERSRLYWREGQVNLALLDARQAGANELQADLLKTLGEDSVEPVPTSDEPVYFFSSGTDPVCYGLLRVGPERVEREWVSTLPRAVLDKLREVVFDLFNPQRASRGLSQAAFLAFQAGCSGHAAYLCRKARQLDPTNQVAEQSARALQEKGARESGCESACLASLVFGNPSAQHNLPDVS